MSEGQRSGADNPRIVKRLLLTAVAMFGFGYALVPLYDVLCEVTGFGGRTGVVEASAVGEADTSRTVTVEFLGTMAVDLDWEFRPLTKRLEVHPGQIYEVKYFAKNLSSVPTVGVARPSVSPSEASLHFDKTECFCFNKQAFAAGEGREMAVRFVVAKELPERISTVTLSYTFFNAGGQS